MDAQRRRVFVVPARVIVYPARVHHLYRHLRHTGVLFLYVWHKHRCTGLSKLDPHIQHLRLVACNDVGRVLYNPLSLSRTAGRDGAGFHDL